MFFLEQHEHKQSEMYHCELLRAYLHRTAKRAHSICGVKMYFLLTGWKQVETVWIVIQHPASLFQDQLWLSNSLFRSRAVKHQPLPIVQLPWTIGWCNLTNKTNLHSTHLTGRYFSLGDMGPFILIKLFKQQHLSGQQSKFKTLLALVHVYRFGFKG